jgi:hypothetical protein
MKSAVDCCQIDRVEKADLYAFPPETTTATAYDLSAVQNPDAAV